MRHVLVKNVGETVSAVTDWDGVSHINVRKHHTLVECADPRVVEGVRVDLEALKAKARDAVDQRAVDQAAAEAASKERRLGRARDLISGSEPAAPSSGGG